MMAHKKPKAAVSGLLMTRHSVHSVHCFLHWLFCHSSVCSVLQRQACSFDTYGSIVANMPGVSSTMCTHFLASIRTASAGRCISRGMPKLSAVAQAPPQDTCCQAEQDM